MKYYLVDTSAIIHTIENTGNTKIDFFSEKAKNEAFLYIPQFCIAEALNTFARFLFKEKRIKEDEYTKRRNIFLNAVRNRKILYVYDLHRYHNLNADRVYRVEQTTPLREKEHPLSSFDILIIAMALELKRLHHPSDVIMLTRDARLKHIANKLSINAIWFE